MILLKQKNIISLISLIVLLLLLYPLTIKAAGNTFYVAPADPEITTEGDGSYDNPWRNLQDVITNKVETRRSKNSPYDGELIIKNEGAPIKAGDTIILKDGFYGKLKITHSFNEDYITIKSENNHLAVFSHLYVMSSSHWILNNLAVNREIDIPEDEQNDDTNKLIKLEGAWHGPSQYITIEECEISTIMNSSAWSKEDWDQKAVDGIFSSGKLITINNNHLFNINYGIQIQGGSNSTVSNNLLDGICADGLQGIGDDLIFENNIVKNFYQVDGNHLDGFQSWIKPPSDPNGNSSDRITIRGNIFIEHEDSDHPFRSRSLQGICIFDGPCHDWVIENNVVIVGSHWGIALEGGQNSKIINNTILAVPGSGGAAQIRVFKTTYGGIMPDNVIVRNNITKLLNHEGNVIVDHNLIISEDQYDDVFVNAIDDSNYDLHLKPGSLAINTGSSSSAPDIDIEGNSRPYGNGYDIGAYEYQGELDPPPAAPTNLEVE
ncbi:MAG: choice-of-anchor Q domain-containing protein [Halanaerobiales bacterium]